MPSNTIWKDIGLAVALTMAASQQLYADEEAAPADEIILLDGSRILGTVTGSRDGVVTIETDFAGKLEVALDKIDSLHSKDDAVLLLADETVIEEQPLVIENQQLVVVQQADSAASIPLEDLSIVNPAPWELGRGYKWTGLVNFALELERGNTDTDELDYKLDTSWRSKRDRFIVRWNGEIDEANGEKSADNWQAIGKYDYFLTDPNYWGAQILAEEDKFEDLDLRYLVGPYLGRQFYDEPIFSLSGELGIAYVNEEFIVAEDQDYPATQWYLEVSSNYLGGNSRLYLNQLGIWNLDETDDVIVNSSFGVAFPLLWNFEAAAEIVYEYDTGAVDDVDDLDEKYNIRLGYTW